MFAQEGYDLVLFSLEGCHCLLPLYSQDPEEALACGAEVMLCLGGIKSGVLQSQAPEVEACVPRPAAAVSLMIKAQLQSFNPHFNFACTFHVMPGPSEKR